MPHLFLNNLQAAFLSVVLGFVPLLPLFVLFVNANVMAAALAVAGQTGASIWKVVIFGVLPHGIFELPALLLCISLGIYLFKELINRKKEVRFLETLEQIARAFLLVVLPLLIIASLIECYITPLLMGLVL